MPGTVEARLRELGIELPKAAASVANYVPYVVSGSQVYVSGQVSYDRDGIVIIPKNGVIPAGTVI